MQPEQPPSSTPARIEVCEKHGLRYNAATDDGCARCRTEAGKRAIGPRGFSPARQPDMGRSLMVAGLLVVGVGLSLFAVHTVAYKLGTAVMEQTWQEIDEETVEGSEDDFPFD